MTNNEAAQPGAAFVVCTTKPGVVAKLQHFDSNDQAKAYVSGLPRDSIHTIVSRHIVFETFISSILLMMYQEIS